MPKHEQPVRWAPRVRQDKIRRLYQLDAQGIADDTLIDEVGYALYSRCLSILQVGDAMDGRVHCPRCDTIIDRQDDDEELRCPQCGWETTWEAYRATYRTDELGPGGARPIFGAFVADWATARSERDKMIAIDRVIHSWHWETQRERPNFGLGRPTGANLIEGNQKQVLALLDALAYGAGGSSDLQVTKAAWRKHWKEVKARKAMGRRKATQMPKADET